jgi:hypothetical protein
MHEAIRGAEEQLEVGGICCVDARLMPNTLDNLLRGHIGELFLVGVNTSNGTELIHTANGGSLSYGERHVNGINILNGGAKIGNGHIVVLGSSPSKARVIERGIKEYDAVQNVLRLGGSITIISFHGKEVQVSNESTGFGREIQKAA